MTPIKSGMFAQFDRVEIINLPNRSDRRRAVVAELSNLGVHVDGNQVSFFPAVRPDDPGEFETIGARGCFLSHLGALKKALDDDVEFLLILEDDVSFSVTERSRLAKVMPVLASTSWDIFYGGSFVDPLGDPVTRLHPDTPAMLAHFIAFSRQSIRAAVPYLEAMLMRPAGSVEGGPMHVDGAYCWLRRANPHLITLAATPVVAHQRSSGTDIHHRRGLDRIPLLRSILGPVRAFKNWRRARS